MSKRNVQDCIKSIKQLVKNGTLSDVQADELVKRMDVLAKNRAASLGMSINDALKQVEGEILTAVRFEQRVQQRNKLLTIRAQRDASEFVKRFDNWGEGLQSFMEGGTKKVKGARLSVDYTARSLYHKHFGGFMAELERHGVTRAFRSGKIDREIYMEVAALSGKGAVGVSGNKDAMVIAQAWNRVRREMVSRQNRAGAYIREIKGYIMRQTHDSSQIQKLGRLPSGKLSKDESFKKWFATVMPLLDHAETFKGADPRDFLKKVHSNLYTGIHSTPADEAEIAEFFAHGSLAKSASAHRVLHFKDADSAFQYNHLFGTKNFSDGVLSDMLFRSRNIALMEMLGPNPKITFDNLIKTLSQEARDTLDDAAAQVKRLSSWRVKAAFAEVAGLNEYPANITLDKVGSTIRVLTQLAKMGGVTLSSLGDKAFLQSEMTFQGMSHLQVFSKQMINMVRRRSKDEKAVLHSMGIALDSLIGNTISRYTVHSAGPQRLHRLQQKFYSMNFMNWWNDVHKATAGELMAHHLGRNAEHAFGDMDPHLRDVLDLYDIGHHEWEALRHAAEVAPNGEKYLTPQSFYKIPTSRVDDIVRAKGWKVSSTARARVRNELEGKLRTYFTDRIDMAVPTPGAAERKFMTMGTQAGTPLGESMRMLAMFKSFPTTVFRKVLSREVYGRGAKTMREWFMHDHIGKFRIAQLIAMTTIGGYLSGAIKDLVKGRTPKPLVDERDGSIRWEVVNDAFLRGGGAGIMGDFLFTEYDRSYNHFLGVAAGPVFGQMDMLSAGFSKAIRGEDPTREISKVVLNNTPFINLFYIRPILDYFVIWNLQEMVSPGYTRNLKRIVEKENQQEFIIDPTRAVR